MNIQNREIKDVLDEVSDNVQNREKLDQIIDELIELKYDGLQQDSKGFTPMMYAVKYNYVDIMERLLEYLKDTDIDNNIFNKPLHIEDNIGNSIFDESKHENSKLLIMINYLNQENKSALSYAIALRNYDVACKLILHGASIDRVSIEQQRELLIYASRQTHKNYTHQYHELRPVVGLLAIKVPEAVKDYSDDYEYPRLLSYFCAYGHTKVVASLLGAIEDNNRRIKIINHGDNSSTPLDNIKGDALSDDDHYKITKYLFENGATKTANNVDPVRHRAISACDNGHLTTFKYLENKADKKDFNTYIGLATRHDHMNIIEYIWNKYRNYTTTYQKDTALHYAAWRGRLKSIKYLCEHGADVNAVNNKSETPLDNAIDDNTIDVIKYFAIEQNAKTEKYKKIQDSMKKILIATAGNVNNQDTDGSILLHKAILTEKIIFTKYLCSLGCNINAQNLQGFTPLHFAARQSNPDITKFLLQHGAIYDAYTNNNKTALDISILRGGLNRLMLSNIDFLFKSKNLNVDLNDIIKKNCSCADAYDPGNPMVYMIGAKNRDGQTLLHKAVFLNDKDAVLLLLKYDETYQQLKEQWKHSFYNHVSNYEKLDIFAQDFNGNTCIHLAAAVGNEDILDVFQNIKHFLNTRNNLGQTPINIAAKNGYKNCVRFMINKLKS